MKHNWTTEQIHRLRAAYIAGASFDAMGKEFNHSGSNMPRICEQILDPEPEERQARQNRIHTLVSRKKAKSTIKREEAAVKRSKAQIAQRAKLAKERSAAEDLAKWLWAIENNKEPLDLSDL